MIKLVAVVGITVSLLKLLPLVFFLPDCLKLVIPPWEGSTEKGLKDFLSLSFIFAFPALPLYHFLELIGHFCNQLLFVQYNSDP